MEYQTLKTKRRIPITEILLVFLIVLTGFKSCSNAPATVARTEKQVNRSLQPVLKSIEVHQQQVDAAKPVMNSMNQQFIGLMAQLDSLKRLRDTVLIIRHQDTVILFQEQEKLLMRQVINDLDSVNTGLRYVVSAKDTIISIKDQQIRKVKRQRNWSLIANGVLTGLLILK